ncbi:MAG: ascorbate-dependent monooxygenase [Acidobacteriota bacterium]
MKRIILVPFLTCAFALISSGMKESSASQQEITFSNQVVRIFQQNCQTCHHPGDIAPFSLMTYRDARPWARSIKEKVILREMPPWKPTEGCGDFVGVRRLTDAEIQTISEWVDEGAVEGNPADLPEPLSFPDEWTLGQPDVILQPDADYTVKPGNDIYRCFTMPTALRGDRYISAVEIKPGNRNVVHHVILYIDTTGVSRQLDEADPGPGYTSFGGPGFDAAGTLGGWAPGFRAQFLREGMAWPLPNGARIVAQVHYHPRGAEETDRTQIGLYFARAPVKKDVQVAPIINTNFTIPANDPHYRVNALFIVPPGINAHAIGIAPHMHLLGREMKVEARYFNGDTRCLINIDDWDFNWQGVYDYEEPVPLPQLTQLSLTAYYDNSANNPFNPNNPPRPVRWGEQTTDEMCIAFILFTLDSQNNAPSQPQISDVSVQGDKLRVKGSGFLPGADIEIDGQRLVDTKNHKKKKKSAKELTSNQDWKTWAAAGRQSIVTVLNTDGVRSEGKPFVP